MDEMMVRIVVQGANSDEEEKWALDVGTSAYNTIVQKFLNPIYIPWYNFRWKIYEKLTRKKVDYADENGRYQKEYMEKSSKIITQYCRKHGGIRENRQIRINANYTFVPQHILLPSRYVISDMIYVEDKGA